MKTKDHEYFLKQAEEYMKDIPDTNAKWENNQMFNKQIDLKEIVEEKLGCGISIVEVNPIFEKGRFVGLDIRVRPKQSVQYINCNMTITKTGSEFAREDGEKITIPFVPKEDRERLNEGVNK